MSNWTRRRNYLVNKGIQFGYAGIVIWLMLNMALVLATVTYFLTMDTVVTQLEASGLTTLNVYDIVAQVNGILLHRLGILLLGLVAIAGLIEIYFLHRVVGPVYVLERRVRAALDGEPFTPVTLRKKDYFQGFADVVNELMRRKLERDQAVEALLAAVGERPELSALVERVRGAP